MLFCMFYIVAICVTRVWHSYYKENVIYEDIAPCPHISKGLQIMQNEFFWESKNASFL